MVKLPLYTGLCKQRVLWNECCLFFFHSFGRSVQYFPLELLIAFFWFFSWSYIIGWSKNWQSLIFGENSFLLIFGEKKGPRYSILNFFWKFCHLIFLKTVWKENYCNSWLPTGIFMPGKIIVIELSSQLLSINEITGFRKVQYLNNELGNKVDFLYVSDSSIRFCLTWVSMPKLLQNDK